MEAQSAKDGTPIPREGDRRFRWFCPKPTVRILFYTDSDLVNLEADVHSDLNEFGVRILRDLLYDQDTDLAEFEITLLNRFSAGSTQELTPAVLAPFDQVWFFGIGYADGVPMLWGGAPQPDNELTSPEIAALTAWMTTGGVLMAGDHANRVADANDPNRGLLCLGRAIGHLVPRAGLLRRWEGNPARFDNARDGDVNYNTQVFFPAPGANSVESLDWQQDERPQRLLLTTYPAPGAPPWTSFGREVHPLFCGRDAPITVFPDHMHEGHIQLPTAFPVEIWPTGPEGQPRPTVVARGTDKVTGEIYDIAIAYDGSSAGVGRIVSDSSWHHYFNVNLKGFPPGGYVRNQMAQYYTNLAVWLSPPAKRRQMACWWRWKLVHNPSVAMTVGNARMTLGKVAYDVVRRKLGPCVVREVFELASKTPPNLVEPPPELLLGGVLDAYFTAFSRTDRREKEEASDDIDALVARGLLAAHDDFVSGIEQTLADGRQARAHLAERLRRDGYIRGPQP